MFRKIRISLGILFILGGLSLTSCTADAQRIREANTAAASSSDSPNQTTGKISVFDLRDGDCFDAPTVPGSNTIELSDVELVPCSGDWAYQTLNSFIVDLDGDYPGVGYFDVVTESSCNRLTDVILFPYPESWELGDRSVLCLMEK